MPAHNRLRPNDRHRIEHTRYEPVEPYEAKAVEPAEGRALMATPTQQYIQLMTKRYHLCLKRGSRPEDVEEHPLEKIQELPHPAFIARFGPSGQADGISDRWDIGAARLPAGWQVWWLRFRMMIERGPRERPQASEEKRTWNIMPD